MNEDGHDKGWYFLVPGGTITPSTPSGLIDQARMKVTSGLSPQAAGEKTTASVDKVYVNAATFRLTFRVIELGLLATVVLRG